MIGDRIRQARTAAGLTQDEVVGRLEKLGSSLTKGGLSKYERGGSVPKPSVLRSLAKVLAVETQFFLEEPSFTIRWLGFRKAPRLSIARQEHIKSLAETQIELILDLRGSLEVSDSERPKERLGVRTPEDAENAAGLVRDFWQLGAQPIESITAAIEDNGGVVIESDGGVDLFDGLAGWANETFPVVVVSSTAPDDRKRFSLAHEIGHLFMEMDQTLEPKEEERLAHRFAAAFLVPAETARRELGAHRRKLDFKELEILKLKHGLSMQAWIFRALDLEIIEASYAKSLLASMSARGWRRKEPVELHAEERPLKLQQLVLRALAEGLLSYRRAEKIWPEIGRNTERREDTGTKARSFLNLPKADRDLLLGLEADAIAKDYEPGGKLAGLESLSEGDYFELYPTE